MPSKFKITGTPLNVQSKTINKKRLYFVDFIGGGSSIPPKGLPTPSEVSATVILNEKQYKKFLFKRNFNKLSFLIEGEVTKQIPPSSVKGEYVVSCYSISEIPQKNK
ncbi:hypothetical protein [Priestia aryabhattai]